MSTKRITLNVFATYTQTVVSIIVGLFTLRWVFSALGEEQYGIFGVVGSIIAFAALFNGVMTSTNARFFAYAIGEGRKDGEDFGNAQLHKWFNTSIAIHLVLGLALCTIFYPIGIYLIENKLTIPEQFLSSSIVVFRISILTLFFTILTIPFYAFYTAKQLIFVRNIVNIIQTLLCAWEGWFILTYAGDRLVTHSALTSIIIILVHLTITILAFCSFVECKINTKEWFNKERFKKILSFTSFSIFGSLGNTLSSAGINVVMNIFYGPVVNSMISISNTVAMKTAILSDAICRAVAPEITSRVGAKDMTKATSLAIDVSLFSSILSLIVIIPLMFYMEPLLILWLKTPPSGATYLVIIMLINSFILNATSGYTMLINASGKIGAYSMTLGAINGSTILFAYVFSLFDTNTCHPLINLAIAWLIPHALQSFGRILFAKQILNLKTKVFFQQIFIPLTILIALVLIPDYYFNKFIFSSNAIMNTLLGIMILCIINTALCLAFIYVWDTKITKANRIPLILAKIKQKLKR